ncbi:RNA polymerase sigma factor [Thermosyntropha sp.]|uniref:RNA polymerase sigma factor n=1 Tax=Thermosyntropha sp. TaxID=2740820 RepID=UPI0025EFD552|nr:sigma-70 family RNA polymerase sigma factor [Thermosyntropha sp.]MBO8158888.1 sigma-70 family RNA polymerase sigma factor [Thermosyntropha sp.]
MHSDEQLVKKSLQGDVEAFDELVLRYQNKVYALAYRYMGNEEDAYDMTQEAFLKAFRSLRTFKGNSSFSTWLYRLVTNVCLDELRRRKRRIVPLSLDEPLATRDGDEVEKEIVDPNPTADILYESKEFAEYILSFLHQMKPEHKAVIVLRDMMELSYEEIAQILNCSVGTVKSRISRARNILRKKIEEKELLF